MFTPKLSLLLAAAATFSTPVAQGAELTGYIIDRLCLSNCEGKTESCNPDGSNSFFTPELHTGWCLLLPPCVGSGYMLVSTDVDADGKHSIIANFTDDSSQTAIVDYINKVAEGTLSREKKAHFPLVTVVHDDDAPAVQSDGGTTSIIQVSNAQIMDPWPTSAYTGADTTQKVCSTASEADIDSNNMCFRSDIKVSRHDGKGMIVIEANGCPDHENMSGGKKAANSQILPGEEAVDSSSPTGEECCACKTCDACTVCGGCEGSEECEGCDGCDACDGCDTCDACEAEDMDGCKGGTDGCAGDMEGGCKAEDMEGCMGDNNMEDECKSEDCSGGDMDGRRDLMEDEGKAEDMEGCKGNTEMDECKAVPPCSASVMENECKAEDMDGCQGDDTDSCTGDEDECCDGDTDNCCAVGEDKCCATCGCDSCKAGCGCGCGSDTTQSNTYKPMYQHYTMMIPQVPASPGSATKITDNVVGLMTNGVLLDSHKQTWSYDSCNGHSDKKHQYHYHIPPICYLKSLGVPIPSKASWWIKDDVSEVRDYDKMADQFDKKGSSPVIGYARDGFPIYALYDSAGDLQRSALFDGSTLDECNGKDDGNGYAYYITPEPPFVPTCLRGEIGSFSYSTTDVACPKSGIMNSIEGVVKTPTTPDGDTSPADGSTPDEDTSQAKEEDSSVAYAMMSFKVMMVILASAVSFFF